MPLYLHNIQEQNSFHIGLTLIPASAMVILIVPWIGSLTDRYGPKKILITGFIAFIISAYIQTTFSTHTHLYEALIAFSLMGIGWSCILNPSIVIGLSSLPEKDSAVGMGTIGTIHHFGGTVGLTIGTVIVHHFSLTKLTTLLRTCSKSFDQ